MDSCGSGYGQVADFCEHGKEIPVHNMREISRSAEELLGSQEGP